MLHTSSLMHHVLAATRAWSLTGQWLDLVWQILCHCVVPNMKKQTIPAKNWFPLGPGSAFGCVPAICKVPQDAIFRPFLLSLSLIVNNYKRKNLKILSRKDFQTGREIVLMFQTDCVKKNPFENPFVFRN